MRLGWTGPNSKRAGDVADNVARVHSHQLLGHGVTLSADVSTHLHLSAPAFPA